MKAFASSSEEDDEDEDEERLIMLEGESFLADGEGSLRAWKPDCSCSGLGFGLALVSVCGRLCMIVFADAVLEIEGPDI